MIYNAAAVVTTKLPLLKCGLNKSDVIQAHISIPLIHILEVNAVNVGQTSNRTPVALP
jgi:hypothetical protein